MIKDLARKILTFLHLDLTKNLKYDRLTKVLMSKILSAHSNCIDVGCHKGEMLDLLLHYAPKGKHYAFEPIPEMFERLQKKYARRCKVLPYALSDKTGETTFNFVKNAPAYSGIKQRKYNISNPDILKINVELSMLDNIIPPNIKIDFIKIDVEGAELGVLKGSTETIKRCKPFIVFEFGLGASDYYRTKPDDIFVFLVEQCGLNISNIHDFLHNKPSLNLKSFSDNYYKSKEYYFVAHP